MAPKSLPMPPTTDHNGSGTAAAPRIAVPRLPNQPRQPRRAMVALGVLLVAGGGLLSFQVVAALDDRIPVVVTTRDVAVGQRIGPADVTTAMVGADERVVRIPGDRLRQVVGKVSVTDLPRGALVAPAAVADGLRPQEGQQLVPVPARPGRLPARGLSPGDRVLVVEGSEGPGAQPVGGSGKSADLTGLGEITAVVDRVATAPDTDGLIVVDVLVPAADGPRLTRAAGGGQLGFSLLPKGR